MTPGAKGLECSPLTATQGSLYFGWPVIMFPTHPHVLHTQWKSAALHSPGSPCWCENCLAVKRQRAANASREISQVEEMDYWASFKYDIFEDFLSIQTEHRACHPCYKSWVPTKKTKQSFFVSRLNAVRHNAVFISCYKICRRAEEQRNRSIKGSISESSTSSRSHITFPNQMGDTNVHAGDNAKKKLQQKEIICHTVSVLFCFLCCQWDMVMSSSAFCKQIQMWWSQVSPCTGTEATTRRQGRGWHVKSVAAFQSWNAASRE